MSKLLSLPKAVLDFVDMPIVESNMKTSTWIVLGALLYQGLSLLLTQRLAFFILFVSFLAKFIPTVLISTGQTPNEALARVERGKTTALFPNADGSAGKPAARGLAVLIIGVHYSHPLGMFSPGAKDTADRFLAMAKKLQDNPSQYGYLSGRFVKDIETDSTNMIAYFESMQAVHDFAQSDIHREAWNWWNKNAKQYPHLGVFHEVFEVPAHAWEAVYLDTPKMGLGAAKVTLEDGSMKEVITDARKGVWKSSTGRMGRGEGWVPESDPYREL